MIISESFLSAMVVVALICCALAPLTLLFFLFVDWRKQRLW